MAAHDEAVAIIVPGVEVQTEFAMPPPVPVGWSQLLVLEARGWAKDMDLFIRDGEPAADGRQLRRAARGTACPLQYTLSGGLLIF